MKYLLVVTLLFVSLASAQSRPATNIEAFGLTMHVLGNEVRFWISDKDLDDSPEWLAPENSIAPFSISDAIRVSKLELGRYGVDRPETWHVSQVTIHRFHGRARWFYIVEWRPREPQVGDGVSIPVLITGRAVVGEIEREMKQSRVHTN